MTTPAELLAEARATLTRAEALIARAGEHVGPPFDDALLRLASEAANLRRRLRNAATTATGRIQR
jgi:hypothetical protein